MSNAENQLTNVPLEDNKSGELVYMKSEVTTQQPTTEVMTTADKARKLAPIQDSFEYEWDIESNGCYGSFISCLGNFVGSVGMIPCCFCFPSKYKRVEQGYVGLVTRFGRLYKSADPGLVKVTPIADKLIHMNVKLQNIWVEANNCMTKDNVNVGVSSAMYYQIVEPHVTAFKVKDYVNSLAERTRTTLRQVVGSRNLQDVIEKREEIAELIANIINEPVLSWGIKIESLLIKSINVPTSVSHSLSMAAEAKRIGESKIIKAKAEVESAKLMRQAADILASKPAMQIRYLDAMQAMANSSNSKVVFMPSQSFIERAAEEGSVDTLNKVIAMQETTK